MKKFLSLLFSFMLTTVSFAQLAWSETTYRTENISGSSEASNYVCNIKGQRYTFKGDMAVAAEKYLKKASVVHVFKLSSGLTQAIAIYALDNYEREVYLGADYIFNIDGDFRYYHERTNGIYSCTVSAFLVKKRKLLLGGREKGFLFDDNGNVVIYD